MYDDQATELRILIQSGKSNPTANAPRILVVTGGKSEVGSSTIAANMAAIVSRRGNRVVLVDADPRGGDLSALYSVNRHSVNRRDPDDDAPVSRSVTAANQTATSFSGDVSSDGGTEGKIENGGPSSHDASALNRIAQGLNLLVAPWATDATSTSKYSLSEMNQFSQSLTELGDHAEYVIVDVGNGHNAMARSIWAVADVAIVTTTPDAVSIMDSYAVIKSMRDTAMAPRIAAVVNRSPNANVAADVFRRLDQSCQRFLGHRLAFAGDIPLDPLLANGDRGSSVVAMKSTDAPAVRAFEQVVRQTKAMFGRTTSRMA